MEMKEFYRKNEEKLNYVFILILLLYPLRHVAQGMDFNDTGYSYANFRYMGLEHMDPMWLFSTYLSTAAGHFLMNLPFADSLIGMNIYTGFLVSVLAVTAYLFCIKQWKISRILVFVGEMFALNLCWCPTADLYNYITYVFMSGSMMLLYSGLTAHQEKRERGLLFLAGVCLGANVLVRFSNLAEAVFIVAVWAYGVLEYLEQEKKEKSRIVQKTMFRTGICLAGYLSALFLLLGYIHLRYGIGNYIDGIKSLFSMTDNASDYKATSMIYFMLEDYRNGMYYVIRLGIIVIGAVVIYEGLKFFTGFLQKKRETTLVFWNRFLPPVSSVGIACLTVVWLYRRAEFASFRFDSYDSMFWPAILSLMLTIGIGILRIFMPGVKKEEKLASGIVILIILITSLGSNNRTYPSINNCFLTAPYLFWQLGRFFGYASEKRENSGDSHPWKISLFPVRCILGVFLLAVCFQTIGFGLGFVFAESTGAKNMTATMSREGKLKGVRMSPERVTLMTELMNYVDERGLQGRDTIFYGDIPALSYYLELPAAFNPWPNLTSYRVEKFKQDLGETWERMKRDESYRPVIILEQQYANCLENILANGKKLSGVTDAEILKIMYGERQDEIGTREITAAQKFEYLLEFAEKNGYHITLRNWKTMILEIAE